MRDGEAMVSAADDAADDTALSPRESLDLISEQRAGAFRSLNPNPVPMLSAWGVTWLLGFGACYLAQPAGGPALLPGWAAWATLTGLSVAAMIITARQVRRSARGVAGTSRAVGAMYGWSWGLGCAAAYGVNMGLAAQGLPARLLAMAWPGTMLLVVGLLYLAGGLLWQDRVHYGLGAWTLLVAVGSVLAGTPGNFALIAVAGGGGLLAAAGLIYQARYVRVPG